jgi:hypothetical protein
VGDYRILPTDSTFVLGSLLLRMLPTQETQQHTPLMSMLRIAAANRSLAYDEKVLPNYQEVIAR